MKVSGATKVFVCFAPDDEKLYERLEAQLNAANKHQGVIELCCNKALAGTDWRAQDQKNLNTAHIILLLVSPAFIDSEYCYSVQTKLAMERQKRDEAIVIPIILRPVHWEQTLFGKLQALPYNAVPVTKSRSRTQDEIFLEITQGVFAAVDKLRHATSSPQKRTQRRKRLNISSPIVRLCPNCIVDFYPGDCDVVSDVYPHEVMKPAPREGLAKIWARMNPEPLIDAEWRRKCPHCGYLLPSNIESVENICVAIIGDTYAGKTCYIASLLHQMKERWVKNSRSLRMKAMTEEIEHEYNHFSILPLMEERMSPLATQIAVDGNRRPLIYELAFRAPSQSQERRINLIFYDASGEDQAIRDRMVHFSRYILRANAIIMLVDPGTIPEINNRLPSHLQNQSWRETGRRAHHLLASTIGVLEQYYGSGALAYFHSTPLAVMLSKSDLLKFTYDPIVPPFRYLANSPAHYLDWQDIRAVDAEVRALISGTSERPILGIAPAFSKLSFFATSATGCACDRNGIFPFVEPSRCLDPLLWVLSQLKIIPPGHSL